MYKIIKTIVFSSIILALVIACNNNQNGVKTSEYKSVNETSNEVITNKNTTINEEVHTVVVNEVLPTVKYSYLNVTENGEQFWIAIRSKDVKVGNTYYYKGGLLKTNFESKEYNRVFDKIYLISNLVALDHGAKTNEAQKNTTKENLPIQTKNIVVHEGSIKIAEIVNNPETYAGKSVQISGVCTKINPGIMNRNWIHLKDGSKDDYDLVVTSDVFVPEGTAITIKADVSLNKDFGAGYTYSLILENGTLIK